MKSKSSTEARKRRTAKAQPRSAPSSGSAARLTFTSLDSQTAFEIKDGSLIIFDPRDAWAQMYHLTGIEAKQLSAWIQRECR